MLEFDDIGGCVLLESIGTNGWFNDDFGKETDATAGILLFPGIWLALFSLADENNGSIDGGPNMFWLLLRVSGGICWLAEECRGMVGVLE